MESLPTMYAAAVLLPLASFALILLFARTLDKFAAWIATSAILGAGLLSFLALGIWLSNHFPPAPNHEEHAAAHGESGHGEQGTGDSANETAKGGREPHAKEKTSRSGGRLPFTFVS